MSKIELPSGRKLYANNEILGINDEYELYEGYDGEIDKTELSVDDIIYLADLAIGRWTVVKNEALRHKPKELLECLACVWKGSEFELSVEKRCGESDAIFLDIEVCPNCGSVAIE